MSLAAPVVNLRTVLGRPLTLAEEDANFSNIRDFCALVGQLFNNDGTIDPTLVSNSVSNYLATSFASSPFLAQVGDVKWTPLPIPSALLTATNGAIWLAVDGTKYLQANYPKLFAYLQHNFDANTKVLSGTIQAGGGVGLSTVTLASGGSGYTAGDVLTIAGGTGTTATVTVSTVNGSGTITSLSITTRGSYTANPASPNTPTGGTGTGASLNVTFSGYQVGDVLAVSGGTGAPARFQVTAVTSGAVTGISLLAPGVYSSAPTTPNNVTGGSGYGAQLNLTFPAAVNVSTEFRVPNAQGLFLFGYDSETPAGTITGEKTHQLTTAEMPAHTHNAHSMRVQHGTTDTSVLTDQVGNASQESDVPILSAGSNLPHNNMPPSIAGYFYILAGYQINGAWV